MLRLQSIARAVSRQSSSSLVPPHLSLRIAPIRSSNASLSTSARLYSSGEGVGEVSGTLSTSARRKNRTDPSPVCCEQTEPVGGENPVSARASGVKKAAKSVADGVEGVAQKATGVSISSSCDHPLRTLSRASQGTELARAG